MNKLISNHNLVVVLVLVAMSGCFITSCRNTNISKQEYINNDFHEVEAYDCSKIEFKSRPKNIILMIGDGMGVSQVFSGITANKGILNIMNMKYIGFSQTQSASDFITESAAGGTAIACGQRTTNGFIGVDEDKRPMESILEIAERNGKVTGLVSTSSITHATPASFIAHQPNRNSHEEIAADFLNTDIEVIIGGGKQFFTNRKDKRNLLNELEVKGHKTFDRLEDAKDVKSGKLTILTAMEHNPIFSERGEMLKNATEKSIEVLSSYEEGFFLMIEGSQIDWGGHKNNTEYIVGEVLDFDKAVGQALKFAAENKETLVIVTADHETSGMAIHKSNIKNGEIKARYTTYNHTGVMVPVFAFGPCAEDFVGIYNNTDIFHKILSACRMKK